LFFIVLPVVKPAAVSYKNGNKLSGVIKGAEKISLRVHGQQYDFVLVKAGTFLMGGGFEQHLGNNNGTFLTKVANTPHWVKITKDFYIGKTEVTQAQWTRFASAKCLIVGYLRQQGFLKTLKQSIFRQRIF
jgi:formylglycine-generating enzyme required for sulfatase activity